MAELTARPKKPRRERAPHTDRRKHPKLPPNATIHKRPLPRPAIPSPYVGASQPKVVYVSMRTPFLSAVKRVEKLLALSEKRLVQSATASAKKHAGQKRKRGQEGHEDEIVEIAREVERVKKLGRRRDKAEDEEAEGMEEVLIKGTGKAVQKVLEMGLWFQQRGDVYKVRLRTGSVGAIDDIEVEEQEEEKAGESEKGQNGNEQPSAEAGAELGEAMEMDDKPDEGGSGDAGSEHAGDQAAQRKPSSPEELDEGEAQTIPETRIRYMSMLEVAVSLR